MKLSNIRLRAGGFLLAAIIAACDQWSKAFVIYCASGMVFPVTILPFFNIVLLFNKGVSFGMLSGAGNWVNLLLPLLLGVIVLILIIWLLRTNAASVALALGFIIGGAAGNLIDRMRSGAVTDFLDFHVWHYHWPAFNVADSAIFIGVVIFLFTNIITDAIPKK